MTSFGGRRNVTDEEIERRLRGLRENPTAGLLDTTKIVTLENPLSEEEKNIQIKKIGNFYQSQVFQRRS